jgi:hypothetical protein
MPNKKISNLNLEITLKDNTSYEKKKERKKIICPMLKPLRKLRIKKNFL